MNLEESKQFVRELITSFPGFEDAARNSPDIGATHRAWIRAWSDLTLAECQSVLSELEKNASISFDEYKSPGPFIRRLVIAARNRGKTSEAERAESAVRRATRDYQGSPMANALAEAIRMRGEGKQESEILAAIERALPRPAAWDGPSYRCPVCCDRQTVVVWRADFVAKVADSKLSIGKLTRAHTCVVSCYCDSASDTNQRRNKKLPVYSSGQFCLYLDDGKDRERLQAWINESRKGKEWAA